MGQKVNPVSYRLQISKDWSSKWFTRNTDFKMLRFARLLKIVLSLVQLLLALISSVPTT